MCRLNCVMPVQKLIVSHTGPFDRASQDLSCVGSGSRRAASLSAGGNSQNRIAKASIAVDLRVGKSCWTMPQYPSTLDLFQSSAFGYIASD